MKTKIMKNQPNLYWIALDHFKKSFESVHFKAKSYQILSNFESHGLKLYNWSYFPGSQLRWRNWDAAAVAKQTALSLCNMHTNYIIIMHTTSYKFCFKKSRTKIPCPYLFIFFRCIFHGSILWAWEVQWFHYFKMYI